MNLDFAMFAQAKDLMIGEVNSLHASYKNFVSLQKDR